MPIITSINNNIIGNVNGRNTINQFIFKIPKIFIKNNIENRIIDIVGFGFFTMFLSNQLNRPIQMYQDHIN